MYLKSIEIQGFKSFANKALLEFNEGVTGIVGPNGSGKSNIADAVRWVLGEQKVKQLRGASMQDVIFSGTELRKPQSFAYVAITLDNSDRRLPVDYNEVTVSRRLYRSGESEYMINKSSCRLKDISELFYDTGIGKEGYSIIGQGQIDAILNGKPEERRYLFDEAAGIVKFKKRKSIAEKKLENERANLVRISDILSELERQVGPLKKQAEAAKEYLKLRDELKLYDLNLFIKDAEFILEKLDNSKKSENTVSELLSDTKRASEELKSGYEKIDEEITLLEETLNAQKGELSKGEALVGNLHSQIELSEERIKAENNSIAYFNDRLKAINKETEEKERTGLSYLRSLRSLKEDLLFVTKRHEESTQAGLSESDVNERELKALSEKIDEFGEKIKNIPGLSEAAENAEYPPKDIENAQESLSECDNAENEDKSSEAFLSSDVDSEDEEFLFEGPSWLKDIKSKQSELNAVKEKEKKVKSWLTRSISEYNAVSEELKSLNKSMDDSRQDYHKASTKLETLRNIAERYEGYGQSVKKVMEAKDRVRGIRGVVADLIKTDRRYETAIETALGGALQNIVTDSEKTAEILIDYLKKNKFGRATFLPLSAVKGRSSPEYDAALKEPGVCGKASELTKTDPEYRELNDYLLKRTLVADNIDNAIKIARKYKYSLKIVTLEGELLNPGGAISGGAYKTSSNLMGRRREIEVLKEEIEKILKRADVLNAEIVSKERELSEKSAQTEELRSQLNEISIEKNTISLSIISDMKIQYSGLAQKTDFISENIDRLSAELINLSSEREELLLQRKAGYDRITERLHFIEKLKSDIENAEKNISRISEELEKNKSVHEGRTASRKEFFKKREELSSELLRLEKEHMRLINQTEKLQSDLDAASEYIWNEYELTLNSAKSFYNADLGERTELKKHISELKYSIRALGPVNIQALDDYKEISERYEFISAQHKDLTESEKSIVAVIEELDKGMKAQFEEKFELIRKEFDTVFKELFGGGKGELEIVTEEGEDILSAGIAIIAQPPGKKLQNMMQLSGGEKALTAIALLFAIQNLKPSPFCLLDEIEAALDDSNVGRFAQYLHRLTEYTQFIIVTHRRGTMEAADRLYGVTMQEKGVTALVSVDLVADKLDK